MTNKEITKALLKDKAWIKVKGVMARMSQEWDANGYGHLHLEFITIRQKDTEELFNFVQRNYSVPNTPVFSSDTELLIIEL